MPQMCIRDRHQEMKKKFQPMASNRILYVCQEVAPYVPDTEGALLCRRLSQAMQERGNEIRTFMPRYGCINERRHQLHEVIRLSGMNLSLIQIYMCIRDRKIYKKFHKNRNIIHKYGCRFNAAMVRIVSEHNFADGFALK